jgi:hypothetical protein
VEVYLSTRWIEIIRPLQLNGCGEDKGYKRSLRVMRYELRGGDTIIRTRCRSRDSLVSRARGNGPTGRITQSGTLPAIRVGMYHDPSIRATRSLLDCGEAGAGSAGLSLAYICGETHIWNCRNIPASHPKFSTARINKLGSKNKKEV